MRMKNGRLRIITIHIHIRQLQLRPRVQVLRWHGRKRKLRLVPKHELRFRFRLNRNRNRRRRCRRKGKENKLRVWRRMEPESELLLRVGTGTRGCMRVRLVLVPLVLLTRVQQQLLLWGRVLQDRWILLLKTCNR